MQWDITGTRASKAGRWKLEASTRESAERKATSAGIAIHELRPLDEIAGPAEADYALSSKGWAALILLPLLAIVVGGLIVLRVTRPAQNLPTLAAPALTQPALRSGSPWSPVGIRDGGFSGTPSAPPATQFTVLQLPKAEAERIMAPAAGAENASTSKPSAPHVTVTRAAVGTMVTDLGEGFAVNKGSSLSREWMTVHYTDFPADLLGTTGISTEYKGMARGYDATTKFTVFAREPLSAIEVRIITFDVWGERLWTLYGDHIGDLPAGATVIDDMSWYFTEHDVSALYTSIAYISRVRTRSGKIIETDPAPVIDAARQFSRKFSPSDLEKSEPGRK